MSQITCISLCSSWPPAMKLMMMKLFDPRMRFSCLPTHLLVVLDLVLQDDAVGPLGLLPCQRHAVPGDVLGLDGRNWRGSWRR